MTETRRRITIRDIARTAGVSPAAVSFALNNRPGVADDTRERILATAQELGWRPNAAARALSASRACSIGLVIARPTGSVSGDHFFFDFIVGAQEALGARGYSLLLQLVPHTDAEIDTYRTWWGQRRIDGVILLDPRESDPRPAVLRELGLPAVITGEPIYGFASLVADDAALMTTLVDHLVATGRRRIAYVSGDPHLTHVRRRGEALEQAGRAHGVEVRVAPGGDATEIVGREQTELLLAGAWRPDAVVYDNDILTLGGLAAARAAGVRIGTDLAVASCEDSDVCRVVDPAITVAHRSPAELGSLAGELMLDVLEGQPPRPVVPGRPQLIVRGSTDPASSVDAALPAAPSPL